MLYGICEWDTTPSRGLALDTATDAAADLTEFALQSDALLLFHPIGMGRYDFEFLPEETYVFPYGHLQPKPLLLPLAQAIRSRKSKTRQSG